MPDFLAKNIHVNSLAKPITTSLLASRKAIQMSSEMQEIFRKAKTEKWGKEALADALFVHLPNYIENCDGLWDTALYLADEFFQLGDCTLLISPETGEALQEISEQDIYLPPPVPREGQDSLAQPLPRLRPELESYIIQRQFERGKDQRVLRTLSKRVHSSELLKQDGDRRLLVATREGRKQITNTLKPETFLPPESGISKDFCALLCFDNPEFNVYSYIQDYDNLEPCSPATAFAKVITPVMDALTFNLHYDPYTALKKQLAIQWVQCFARSLATLHHEPIEASITDQLPPGFWVAEPDIAIALRGKKVLPVRGATAILLHPKTEFVARVCIDPQSYECKSREFLDRWEVAARCNYTLYVNTKALSFYRFRDVEQTGMSFEVTD